MGRPSNPPATGKPSSLFERFGSLRAVALDNHAAHRSATREGQEVFSGQSKEVAFTVGVSEVETWKDVPGFEGRYQVSDLGRVRSLDRPVRSGTKNGKRNSRVCKGRILRPGTSRGYLIVNLPPKGTIAVHRLVAIAFVSARMERYEVNHIDGNKSNNSAVNLEWVSKSENQQHAVRTGLKKQAIRLIDNTSGATFPSITSAARFAKCRARTLSAQWGRA